MKYVIFADPHLSGKDREYVDLDGKKYPRKEFYVINNMYNALEQFKVENPEEEKNLIIAGDIFHHKNYAHASSEDLFSQFLFNFEDWNKFIIAGNHDVSDKTDNPITLLSHLKHKNYKNLTILEPGETLILENKILLLPWSKNFLEVLQEKLESYKNLEVLVGHFGINEAVLSSGLSHVDRITFKDLSLYFKMIILGHYHKPQLLENEHSKLIYVGSVIQENWGESNEEKRYIVFDSETYEFQSIPTIYPRYITEFTNEIDFVKNTMKEKLDEDQIRIQTHSEEIYDFCKDNGIECVVKLEKSVGKEDDEQIKTIDMTTNVYLEYLKYKNIEESEYDIYLEKLDEIIG